MQCVFASISVRWPAWWRSSRRKGIYFNCKSFVKRKVICNASSIPLKRALLPCLSNQSYVSSQCFWEDRRSWYTCLCWDRSCKLRIGSMTVWMVACLSHAWICHWSNCCSVANSEMKKGVITPMRDVVKASACRKDFCPPSLNLSTACFSRQVVLLEGSKGKVSSMYLTSRSLTISGHSHSLTSRIWKVDGTVPGIGLRKPCTELYLWGTVPYCPMFFGLRVYTEFLFWS